MRITMKWLERNSACYNGKHWFISNFPQHETLPPEHCDVVRKLDEQSDSARAGDHVPTAVILDSYILWMAINLGDEATRQQYDNGALQQRINDLRNQLQAAGMEPCE